MIIKSKPTKSATGINRLYTYLTERSENDDIRTVGGSKLDMLTTWQDAKSYGRKNSFQHFILSSKETLTNEQFKDCCEMLGDEFGFSTKSDIALAVIHTKNRHGEADDRHFHLVVKNVDDNGKTLNMSHSYARQEKIARQFELKHGLELTKGKHNKAILHAVGIEDAQRLQHLAEGLPANGTRHNELRASKPETETIKIEAKELWKQSNDFQSFKDAIEGKGWHIKPGTKKPEVLILTDENDKFIGSLNRILSLKKDELSKPKAVQSQAVPPVPEAPKVQQIAPRAQASRPTYRPPLISKSQLFDMQQDIKKFAKLSNPSQKKSHHAGIGLPDVDVSDEWEKAMEIARQVAEQIGKHIEECVHRMLGLDADKIRRLEDPKKRESFHIKDEMVRRIQPEYQQMQARISELSTGFGATFRNRKQIAEEYGKFQKTLDRNKVNAKSTDEWGDIAYFIGDTSEKLAMSRSKTWNENKGKIATLDEYADNLHKALDEANAGDENMAKLLTEGKYDEAVALVKKQKEIEKEQEEIRKKEELDEARRVMGLKQMEANGTPVNQPQPTFSMR